MGSKYQDKVFRIIGICLKKNIIFVRSLCVLKPVLRIRLTLMVPDPACHFDAGPDTTFHFDADPDPSFQIKAQNLEIVLK